MIDTSRKNLYKSKSLHSFLNFSNIINFLIGQNQRECEGERVEEGKEEGEKEDEEGGGGGMGSKSRKK